MSTGLSLGRVVVKLGMRTDNQKIVVKIILGSGVLFGLWALSAFVGVLYSADGDLGELLRGYMVATGLITPLHNLVDYYTHIKGIEYLICVAFFVVFPAFYVSLNKNPHNKQQRVS